MDEATPSANRQIARAAGTVMFAIVLGQITGLIRGILVARAFPAAELDAFFAANRVSETLFMLLAAGALGSAFIPTFTGFLAKDDKESAWKLASSIANLLTLTLSLIAILAAIFAPQIVKYALAPGLATDQVLFPLTVNLLRIQLISAVLFGLGGLIVGILNAHQAREVPHFWHKKLVEDRLEELGVPFVSLRPGAFLDQMTPVLGRGLPRGRMWYVGSTKVPMTYVLSGDVARHLAEAVDAPGVEGERIDVGWERPVSAEDLARLASVVLGRGVRVRAVP